MQRYTTSTSLLVPESYHSSYLVLISFTLYRPTFLDNVRGMYGYRVWLVYHPPTHPFSPDRQDNSAAPPDQVWVQHHPVRTGNN